MLAGSFVVPGGSVAVHHNAAHAGAGIDHIPPCAEGEATRLVQHYRKEFFLS